MKRGLLLLLLLLLLPGMGQAEAVEAGLQQALDQVDVQALERVSGQQGLREVILRLARGETVWDAAESLRLLEEMAGRELHLSFSRMLGLMAPALLSAVAAALRTRSGSAAEMAENACFLVLSAALAADFGG